MSRLDAIAQAVARGEVTAELAAAVRRQFAALDRERDLDERIDRQMRQAALTWRDRTLEAEEDGRVVARCLRQEGRAQAAMRAEAEADTYRAGGARRRRRGG